MFNSHLKGKGHILSSKSSSKPNSGNKGELNVAARKSAARPINEAQAPQQVEQEVRERRNGYQTISTAAYYRPERRGLNGFDKARDWLEAESEMGGMPGIDSMDSMPE
ncbi:MAG: DUF2934 domain-containing protein [Nitrosospira sp.]